MNCKKLVGKEDYSENEWNDYRWHLRHAIKTEKALAQWINIAPDERSAIRALEKTYRWQVTPYYASLFDPNNPRCPLRLQAIPSLRELTPSSSSDIDPVNDRKYRKTARVIHKYPNRVAFLVSDTCPVYCRHCTRKYHTTNLEGTYYGDGYKNSLDEDIEYIRQHPEIDDVLLTGGDPLSLADGVLERILAGLRSVAHVNIIRIGSRFPVLLPQRIDEKLCALLERFHPFWLNTHFNHPNEITLESAKAVDRLIRHGIPVQNQSVLLKGVNDCPEIMRALVKKLLSIRVRPYYLYHCDDVTGVSHFRTSFATGRKIMAGLQGFETGFSVPQYILTTGIGKISLQESGVHVEYDRLIATNYKKEILDVTTCLSDEKV